MILSFPRMGNLHLALEEVCRYLELPYLLPSPPGPKALSLGRELAPEGSCFPFILVLGNMREALEMGADTLLMLGGSGPCRFGYFVYLAERILKNAGYSFHILRIDQGYHWENYKFLRQNRRISLPHLLMAIQRGWRVLVCLETLDELKREYLSLTPNPHYFEEYLITCKNNLNRVTKSSDIEEIRLGALEYVHTMSIKHEQRALSIGLVGDIYTLLEPYANQQIEQLLLDKGTRVFREISVSQWFPNVFLPWRKKGYRKKLLRDAFPYLRDTVGGFGLESVSNSRKWGKEGIDGIIHLFPLGCMPEIVARSALNNLGLREKHPILSVTMDEHDSMTGFVTRIEAFLEMITEKKKAASF